MTRITRPERKCRWMLRLDFVLAFLLLLALTVLYLAFTTLGDISMETALRDGVDTTTGTTNAARSLKPWSTGDPLRGEYRFSWGEACRMDSTTTGTTSTNNRDDPQNLQTCLLSYPVDQDDPKQLRSYRRPHLLHGSSYLTTRKGQKGATPNQDRGLLMQSSQSSQQPFLLAALFDGHGPRGHTSADIAVRDLPFRLVQELDAKPPEQWPTIINQTFGTVDQGPIRSVRDGGTTAVVALQWKNRFYFSTTGDSIGFLVRYTRPSNNNNKQTTTTTIVRTAVTHKPADSNERKRIIAAGGQVLLPPAPGLSSRVIYTTSEGMEMALAMSRSLGDWEGKEPGYLTAEPSVIAVDDLQSLLNNKDDEFLFFIVASDGVFDMIPTQATVDLLGNALADSSSNDNNQALKQACDNVMKQAAKAWAIKMMGTYRDDMTLMVARLDVQT